MPGIILTSQFTVPSSGDFGGYVGYSYRREALLQKQEEKGLDEQELRELERVEWGLEREIQKWETRGGAIQEDTQLGRDAKRVLEQDFGGYIDYMSRASALDDQGESPYLAGAFSADKNVMTRRDLRQVREKLRTAQGRGSVLWQDVVSFDTAFLVQEGIYDPATDTLNEHRLQDAGRAMMECVVQKEGLQNPYWFASVHRNTNHVHLHFGLVEMTPSRPIITYVRDGQSVQEPKGKRGSRTIWDMKSAFANAIVDRTVLQAEITRLRQSLKDQVGRLQRDNWMTEAKLLNQLLQELPPNQKGWAYGSQSDHVRGMIDKLTTGLMGKHPEYQQYMKALEVEDYFYRETYGPPQDGKPGYMENQLAQLHNRLGNALLKELKENMPFYLREGSEKQEPAPAPEYSQAEEQFCRELRNEYNADWVITEDISAMLLEQLPADVKEWTWEGLEWVGPAQETVIQAIERLMQDNAVYQTYAKANPARMRELYHRMGDTLLGAVREDIEAQKELVPRLPKGKSPLHRGGGAAIGIPAGRPVDKLDDDREQDDEIDPSELLPDLIDEVVQYDNASDLPDWMEYNMEWSDEYKEARRYLFGTAKVKRDFELALKLFKQEAYAGNALAMHDVGRMTADGLGCEKSADVAAKWYAQALKGFLAVESKDGGAYIWYRIGKMYNAGLGTEKDQAEAARWFLPAANKGNKYAQYSLAGLYLRGEGVEQDAKLAAELYRKSADQENPYASWELAKMLRDGIGVAKDEEESEQYFSSAYEGFCELESKSHDDKLQYRLGRMLENGIGTAQDTAAAREWFEKSAEVGNVHAMIAIAKQILSDESAQMDEVARAVDLLEHAAEEGNQHAQYALGYLFAKGEVIARDAPKAVTLLKAAANQDHEYAAYRLGKLLLDGDGIEKNILEAIGWLEKAVDKGNQYAQYTLGSLLANGEEVAWDPARAVTLFRASASQGNEYAAYRLGKMLLAGDGIEKNIPEAIGWLEKAADKDNQYAQYTLGVLLANGEEVAWNPARAATLFRTSASQGNEYAAYRLGKLMLDGDGIEKNVPEAISWMEMSAEKGNQYAQYALGKIYLMGKDVKKDQATAVRWLQMSADQGNQYAKYLLDNLGKTKATPRLTQMVIRRLQTVLRDDFDKWQAQRDYDLTQRRVAYVQKYSGKDYYGR